MGWDCRERKYDNNNKYEKAEKAIDGDEDDVVLCLLTMENRKENVKEKVHFAEDDKQPSEAGMMCTINGDTFFSFTKNMWIGDSSEACTNDDTSLFDIININELIQGSYSDFGRVANLYE